MSIVCVTLTPTQRSMRKDTIPFDVDSWYVEGLEFSLQNNYQSRHYRTRHVLYFAGSDNVSNQPNPQRPYENTPQQAPHAFLSPQAVCLTATPMPKAPTLDLEDGDVIVGEIPGGPVLLRVSNRDQMVRRDPTVEVLYCPGPTMNHSEYIKELERQRANH
jgi:hypothetical protein